MTLKRLLAAVVLVGGFSIALPRFACAEGAGAKQAYEDAEASLNDAGTTSRIKTALAINPLTKKAVIHVNTNNGVVNLTGAIQNVSIVQQAQEIAQNTTRVKGVRNNLSIEHVSNASYEM
jgi:hyperosmotically inducible periplasmic protein